MTEKLQLPQLNHKSVIRKSTEILENGGVMCVPTDTVYGLICIHNNSKSIERMYSIKGRDYNKPFAVFTDSWERIQPLLSKPCGLGKRFADLYWPGALTILIPVDEDCPCSLNGKLGIRHPNLPLISNLVNAADNLIANTSFNLSNEPSLSSLPDEHELYDQIDLIIDAGELGKPVPSTVIDCTEEKPVIIREGVISEEEIHFHISDS